MERLENVLEEGPEEDNDHAGDSQQSDGDTDRDDVSDRGSCRLLCYDHVGVPALGLVLRTEVLNHRPAQAQSLSNKDGIESEVNDEKEASGP